MSDIFFCFGPEKVSYLIDTKKTFKHKGMPKGLIDAIGNNKVQKIYTVAVQQEKGSYLCYLDQNSTTWHSSAYAMDKSCPSLVQWLETRKAKQCGKHLSVTFGPTNTTYAACAPCCNTVWWYNVPDGLDTTMESLNKVRHVALGAGNSYILLHEGGVRWMLDGHYEALHKILDNMGGSTVTFVALNPWYAEQFFLVLDNDTAYFQVDASLETAILNVMKDEGISCHALQPSSSSRVVSKDRLKVEKIKDRAFLKSILSGTIGGVASHVIITVTSGLASAALACNVM